MSTTDGGRIFNVLFLCTGNSCRSILAEAIMNRAGLGPFKAYSAGSMPTGRVNPNAIDLLKQMHHDTGGLRSKSWEEFTRDKNPQAPDLDFVFTVCDNAAGEICPIWPGQPMTAHWGMPDPALAVGSGAEIAIAFAETYRLLNNRITLFMNLPMASLDRLTLQKRLDQIGSVQDSPAPTAA
jgi:protein-tyrosine-phosphatase